MRFGSPAVYAVGIRIAIRVRRRHVDRPPLQLRNALRQPLCFLPGDGLYRDWTGPVSYTHLDVYKRQPTEAAESARNERRVRLGLGGGDEVSSCSSIPEGVSSASVGVTLIF